MAVVPVAPAVVPPEEPELSPPQAARRGGPTATAPAPRARYRTNDRRSRLRSPRMGWFFTSAFRRLGASGQAASRRRRDEGGSRGPGGVGPSYSGAKRARARRSSAEARPKAANDSRAVRTATVQPRAGWI